MSGSVLALPYISEHTRGPDLQAGLVRVGKYVAGARQTHLYGVELLHRHFEVEPDEALVGWTDHGKLRTRVVKRAKAGVLVPTVWGFHADGEPVALQWAQAESASTTEAGPAVVRLGRFMVGEGLNTTFAAVVLAHTLNAGSGQVLLETTDAGARTQVTIPVQRSEVARVEPAGWRFAADGTPIAMTYCTRSGDC